MPFADQASARAVGLADELVAFHAADHGEHRPKTR